MIAHTLYTQLYASQKMIDSGIMPPAEAFPLVATDAESINVFFKTFWATAQEENHAEIITEQCQKITKDYPEFALFQHLVGIWLYADFNIFNYGLGDMAIQYALLQLLKRGGSLNDEARQYLVQNSLVIFTEAKMSEDAIFLLRETSPDLVPNKSGDLEYISFDSCEKLFPVVESKPYVFPESIKQVITEHAANAGLSLDLADSMAAEVGWYHAVVTAT